MKLAIRNLDPSGPEPITRAPMPPTFFDVEAVREAMPRYALRMRTNAELKRAISDLLISEVWGTRPETVGEQEDARIDADAVAARIVGGPQDEDDAEIVAQALMAYFSRASVDEVRRFDGVLIAQILEILGR